LIELPVLITATDLQKPRTLGGLPAVPDMDNPPGRYDITVRVARDDGHSFPDPAAFAVAASQAASSMNASVVSAHAAEEIICVVSVAALDRPSAVAVALAVVADAFTAEDPVRSPSR
jgi:hypothetical protein